MFLKQSPTVDDYVLKSINESKKDDLTHNNNDIKLQKELPLTTTASLNLSKDGLILKKNYDDYELNNSIINNCLSDINDCPTLSSINDPINNNSNSNVNYSIINNLNNKFNNNFNGILNCNLGSLNYILNQNSNGSVTNNMNGNSNNHLNNNFSNNSMSIMKNRSSYPLNQCDSYIYLNNRINEFSEHRNFSYVAEPSNSNVNFINQMDYGCYGGSLSRNPYDTNNFADFNYNGNQHLRNQLINPFNNTNSSLLGQSSNIILQNPIYHNNSSLISPQPTPPPPRRVRMTYTRRQISILEAEFIRNGNFLQRSRRAELSKETSLTERQIKIWFQNRRMKIKRSSRRNCQESSSSGDTSLV